VRYKLKDDAI